MKRIILSFVAIVSSFLFLSGVSAGDGSYEFSCGYSSTTDTIAERYYITYKTNGDLISMESCEYSITNTKNIHTEPTIIDCSNYEFDSQGYSQADGSDCPSSVDVSKTDQKITWIAKHNGKYNHTAGKDKSEVINLGSASSCTSFKNPNSCTTSEDLACVWVENEDAPNGGYCNVDNLLFVGCGGTSDIPMQVPILISMLVNLLKIATPLILIFVGLITLFKAVVASKEDEMKKAQSSLIKKIIASVMVFFIISIVQFVIMKVADTGEKEELSTCLSCFLNNDCEVNTYYRTVVGGTDMCTSLTTGTTDTCDQFFK